MKSKGLRKRKLVRGNIISEEIYQINCKYDGKIDLEPNEIEDHSLPIELRETPLTIKNKYRRPNGIGFPEKNYVTYKFPGTKYTTDTLKWVWEDGKGAPRNHKDLKLPNRDKLPDQGAMFIGEKGRLLLPHFMEFPKLIIDGKYEEIDISKFEESGEITKNPIRDYEKESYIHYHEFIDSCLGKGDCSAPFSYSARLTETILLGVIAGRFPNKTLHWDNKTGKFLEQEANKFINSPYRKF